MDKKRYHDHGHYGDGDVGDIVGMVEQIIIVMVILMLMTWVVILAMMEVTAMIMIPVRNMVNFEGNEF